MPTLPRTGQLSTTCLNGYWDFLPVTGDSAPDAVPTDGWVANKYLVPSFWTKPFNGVRKKGDTQYKHIGRREIKQQGEENFEFLFDGFGYPVDWSATVSAWMRRTLVLDTVQPGRRYLLRFGAITPRSVVYVNRRRVAENTDPSLPVEADVTDVLVAGTNEIAVFTADLPRDQRGRAKLPAAGNVNSQAGIWQDVYLIERGDVYLDDVTIRTSTRNKTLTAIFSVKNASASSRVVTVRAEVLPWSKTGANSSPVLKLPGSAMELSAGEIRTIEVSVPFAKAKWWSPESPTLYQLRTSIVDGTKSVDMSMERFGFREVWVEGPHVMLNDHPIHIFSDWGHRFAPHHLTEAWNRKWFGMIRDGNMNHTRLHVHPHAEFVLALADEEGVMVTDETALYGSGAEIAGDLPETWDAAREHVRRLVRRDKNHPCLIMWSVENEMRWNRDDTPLTSLELPKLRKLFNELDPTRVAYHEGDSSLWDERKQEIVSRHYGRNSCGTGWWNRLQPLHHGEMSLYHYAGPNNTLHMGGDAVFSSYRALDRASAADTAYAIEDGRALGVCCFGPWNISCLENLRMHTKPVKLTYKDLATPGAKPQIVIPQSSEFEFWTTGKGYTPFESFPIQAAAFRPFALLDTSRRSGYLAGATVVRDIHVVNDTLDAVSGVLRVTVGKGRAAFFEATSQIDVARGHVHSQKVAFSIPAGMRAGTVEYRVEFVAGKKVLDSWTRKLRVAPSFLAVRAAKPAVSSAVAVFGPGSLKSALGALGVSHSYVESLDAAALASARILVLEKGTVTAHTPLEGIRTFVAKGGRLIVMEQETSLFPSVTMEKKAVLTAFVRAPHSPVMKDLTDADLCFWSEDPYSRVDGNSDVAKFMYRKNDAANTLFLVESGEGGFGNGTMDYTPLIESVEGEGLIFGCQLRITDKMAEIPAAQAIFAGMLTRADTYAKPSSSAPIILDGAEVALAVKHVEAARKGATVIVNNIPAHALQHWSKALGCALTAKDVGPVYQAVRSGSDALIDGVSNEDTCGIETFTYAPPTTENRIVAATSLAPAKGIEPILETATESCLRELFVNSGLSEALRAHTVSRFLFKEKPAKAIVTARVKVGSGQVIINQFSPDTTNRTRLQRLANRMCANLGVVREGVSILAGERSAAPSIRSHGHAREIWFINSEISGASRDKLIAATKLGEKRPIQEVVECSFMTNDKGTWKAAGCDLSKDIYFYHRIDSPTQRKNVQTNLGVPNPELLTFMDVTGQGTVELTVNGFTHDPIALTNGEATISDISLEQGENRILIKWTPQSEASTIQLKWRNIMRQPEVGLHFDY